jgi:uncharacterized protein
VTTIRLALAGAALLAALALTAVDGRAIAIGAVHAYQRNASPMAARVGLRCRFTPTCSRYAEAAIARDGVVRGGWRALGRVARCGPWTPMGTEDQP